MTEVETLLCVAMSVYVSRALQQTHVEEAFFYDPPTLKRYFFRWKHDVPGTKPSRAALVLPVEKQHITGGFWVLQFGFALVRRSPTWRTSEVSATAFLHCGDLRYHQVTRQWT